METVSESIYNVSIMAFKSYYVVWKHLANSRKPEAKPSSLNRTMQYGNIPAGIYILGGIRSLNRTMQYGNPVKQLRTMIAQAVFKSYYVVWKLIDMSYLHKSIVGLNRTMQYGNIQIQHSIYLLYQFKSYYVVWKRKRVLAIEQAAAQGLNRTMQYGNPCYHRRLHIHY